MDNLESQEMELLALQNIYEERDFKIDEMNPLSGRFAAQVRLPQSFLIRYRSFQGSLDSQDNEVHAEESFHIEHLPPIDLCFRFPETYPLQTCPAFLLSCNWLTLKQLSDLCRHLESVWDSNRDAILFTWFQFLQDEILDFLKINDSLDITELLKFKIQDNFRTRVPSNDESCDDSGGTATKDCSLQDMKTISEILNLKPSISGGCNSIDARAFNDMLNGKNLIQLLKDHNEKKKEEVFRTSTHVCNICFFTKEGSKFVTFRPCKHSFCIECIKLYFEGQIHEGNVNSLHCPDGECDSQADGSVVRQVVSKELYEKYDTIILSRTLEDMPDVRFCPRRLCQCPVLLDSCGRMGICAACNFVFCALCNMAYHGVAPCAFKEKVEEKLSLYQEYTKGNSAVKKGEEKRYGKRFIKEMVEDTLCENWKSSHSKTCPHCKASIEKIGLVFNKKTCFKCGTYFCYRCEVKLKPSDPYEHFRNSFHCLVSDVERREFDYVFEPEEFLNVNFL
ncbi:E3 ubiquitin-protein ligase RNF14 like protein [Argiope bruennichi]|uniref:RBR-type E3 ubiquitin transferase n=1 Tax=Argiope bruennichi TaxID=94029 RepID=A0A8T0ERQ3_ARGBR|nr:E3 ubiquitin-protein ligase RNF14 like protein [Argiope bruennichi]